jgi:hypothetical protein
MQTQEMDYNINVLASLSLERSKHEKLGLEKLYRTCSIHTETDRSLLMLTQAQKDNH